MVVRHGTIEDINEMQKLFVETVKNVCRIDYTHEQIKAWISTIENKQRWIQILAQQFVLIVEDQRKMVGFATLDQAEYIDLLYVHKEYQRRGIASLLLTHLEKEAIRHSSDRIISDVSLTAKKYFTAMGFHTIEEQTVYINGIELTNIKMFKDLTHTL